jgi:hypothetical protein
MARQREKKTKGTASNGIELAPFPPLKPQEIDRLLAGGDTFKTWAGFYNNPTGVVTVIVYPPEEVERDVEAASKVPPQPAQVEAYRHLKENEAAVTTAVLRAIFNEYPKVRKLRGADDEDYDHEEWPMPPVKKEDELERMFGPVRFYVMQFARDGVAYVGMDMRCRWDPEHGLGVMTHKSRVLKVGEGDVSFDRAILRKDGGKAIKL